MRLYDAPRAPMTILDAVALVVYVGLGCFIIYAVSLILYAIGEDLGVFK